MQRREFIRSGAMAAGAMAVPNILMAQGSKGRVRMGFIGVGNRGTQLMHIFMKNPLVEVTALCDIYDPYLKRDDSAFDPKFPCRAHQGGDVQILHRLQGASRRRERRCSMHRNARPLARDPDHRRDQGRQGRLLREASHGDDRRGSRNGERAEELAADCGRGP